MERTGVLMVLSIIMLLALNGVSAGDIDFCSYSATLYDDLYAGCYCDWNETELCAGDGYKYYRYSCDGHAECPACETCHWWKDSGIKDAIDRLYPVCEDIYGTPWCAADEECERMSWYVTWKVSPLCVCY